LTTTYISLGSNLGDRAANLSTAVERVSAAGVKILRRSSVYETEPRDFHDQPWFLNQVIEVETDLSPPHLLALFQKIELEMGRERSVSKGPRVIDLDILLYGDLVVSTPDLEIPHPRLAERRFVLEPLAELVPELAPDLRHPVTGRTVREMLGSVLDQSVRRL